MACGKLWTPPPVDGEKVEVEEVVGNSLETTSVAEKKRKITDLCLPLYYYVFSRLRAASHVVHHATAVGQ